MLQIISKQIYHSSDLQLCTSLQRILLTHDGSMTKLIEAYCNEPMQVKLITTTTLQPHQLQLKHVLNTHITLQDQKIIQRQTQLSTSNQGLLIYARSFWSKEAYQEIIAKNQEKAIGLHLIEQKLQTFRRINFKGKAKVGLYGQVEQMLCKGYSIRHKGQQICQIQEYFSNRLVSLQLK